MCVCVDAFHCVLSCAAFKAPPLTGSAQWSWHFRSVPWSAARAFPNGHAGSYPSGSGPHGKLDDVDPNAGKTEGP